MKKIIPLYILSFFMLGALIYLIIQTPYNVSKPLHKKEIWSSDDQLKYANTLLAKGLKKQAALAFEDYINKSNATRKELANLCYRVGNIYMDIYEYEKALKCFYKAEMLNKNGDFKEAMNQKIVEALENLGMSSQAQYELAARTSIGKTLKEKGSKIVARIGNEEISESKIDEELDKLPEWARQKYKSKEGKGEFIRQYVAREVLYRKAKRLGIDKNPKTREALESFKKEYLVEQLMKREIKKRLKVTPENLKLYYKANKDKYIEPEAVKISYIEMEKGKKDELFERLKEGEGKRVNDWIEKGSSYIPGIGEAGNIIEEFLSKGKGDIIGPIEIKKKKYIFKIDDKREKRQKSFDEVEKEVEYEYRIEREKEITNSILKKALEEQEVEIFYTPQNEK